MKDGIRLHIGNQWAVLPDDINISIEMTSPLWNESGTFSYSFPLPYTANSHLFQLPDLPESNSRLTSFREKFTLYVDGVCLLTGDLVCASEEIDTENDTIDVELRSDLALFEDTIADTSVRSLDYDQCIGTYHYYCKTYKGKGVFDPWEGIMEQSETMQQKYYANTLYPDNPFVNIPIVVNSEKTVGDTVENMPLRLSPYRSLSSPCFYLLYLYDRILEYSGFHLTCEDPLKKIADIRRMIILNNRFDTRRKTTEQSMRTEDHQAITYTYVNKSGEVYLTSDNLPDVQMEEIISLLKNTFGMRLIPDGPYGLRSVLLRDVLTSGETLELNYSTVVSVTRKHVAFNGIRVKYSTHDGDEYNYNDYHNVQVKDDYSRVRQFYRQQLAIEAADRCTTLLISKETGNYYRIKVDKETNDGASLFEVAQFLPYEIPGEEGREDEPEELELNFQPLVATPCSNFTSFSTYHADEACFIDGTVAWNVEEHPYTHLDRNPLPDDTLSESYDYAAASEKLSELADSELPLTLGILRNSSNGSHGEYIEIVRKDADGLGNDEWVSTVSYNSVTSDSVTHGGDLYDYNGSEEGLGTPASDLISLKLWCCKQNFDPSCLDYTEDGQHHPGEEIYNNNPTGPLPNRGLVPQFLYEYLYFLQHNRMLVIELYLEVSELINLRWEKYYHISQYRCLLNKVSFDLTQDGIGLVTLEVYIV